MNNNDLAERIVRLLYSLYAEQEGLELKNLTIKDVGEEVME